MAFSFPYYEPIVRALAMEFCVDFGFSPNKWWWDDRVSIGPFGVFNRVEPTWRAIVSAGLRARDIDSIGGMR
jgi:hypothetical protein